jgi:hypothetical protein
LGVVAIALIALLLAWLIASSQTGTSVTPLLLGLVVVAGGVAWTALLYLRRSARRMREAPPVPAERSGSSGVWAVSGVRAAVLITLGFAAIPLGLTLVLAGLIGGSNDLLLVGCVTFLFVSVVLVILGGMEQANREWRAMRRLNQEGIRTTGRVVRSGFEPSGNLGDRWIIHYRFEVEGSTYEGSREVKPSPPIEVGDPVTILYDRRRPSMNGWLEPALSVYHVRTNMWSLRP